MKFGTLTEQKMLYQINQSFSTCVSMKWGKYKMDLPYAIISPPISANKSPPVIIERSIDTLKYYQYGQVLVFLTF
jgi:hypothetical protein